MNRYVSLLLFVGIQHVASAQFRWTPARQQAYQDVTAGRVNVARATFTRDTDPDGQGLRLWLTSYAEMLDIAFRDEDRLIDSWQTAHNARLAQLDNLPDDSPWQRLTRAETRLHGAFIKVRAGHEASAGWDVVRAYKLLAENQRRFPDFLLTYKALGVLRVLIGSVPRQYRWVTRLLGLRGDVRGGLTDLARATREPLFGADSRLILLIVKAYITEASNTDTEALHQLIKTQPTNALARFLGATILMKTGHSAEAADWLRTLPTGPDYVPMPIVQNLLGDLALQRGHWAEARQHYVQFLNRSRGTNFKNDTYYKLFLTYWLAGDEVAGRPWLSKITIDEKAIVEADKAARRFAQQYAKQRPMAQAATLMRARLAFDGGFADTALAQLLRYPETYFRPGAERAEYHYRLGRIYQRLERRSEAETALRQALTLSQPAKLGFGALAALQLGYLSQQRGQRAEAARHFRLALEYPAAEYRNSVENKALAGLNALGEEF